MNKAIAIDFGGTKILISLVNENLEILDDAKIETNSGEDAMDIVGRMNSSIEKLLRKNSTNHAHLSGIGVAVPGVIVDGKVNLTNVNMVDFNLKTAIKSVFDDTNVVITNDVNAGLLGEYIAGAGRGYKNLLGLYPGTGLGGAVIVDGKIYEGLGGAGEFGHMMVMPNGPLCGCGNRGCVEAICSRMAMAKELVGLGLKGDAPTIYKHAKGDIAKVKSRLIRDAIDNKETAVIEVVKRSAYFLGITISNLTYCFNPDVVIIGGGFVEKIKNEYYLDIVKKSLHDNLKLKLTPPDIKSAKLGTQSGVIGMASLVFEADGRHVNPKSDDDEDKRGKKEDKRKDDYDDGDDNASKDDDEE